MALESYVIGDRIRRARIDNKLTQENLAEELNVSVAFISRIERGTAHINLKRLSQICTILNIDEGLILNGTSLSSSNYLSAEFSELLNNCSTETQRLIYDIAKVIISNQKKK